MYTSVCISVVIITYNEEKNIARCIDSVYKIADEIVVVDSFSTDNTKGICLQKGVRFIEHPFQGYAPQKNFGISQASYKYIFSIDADEALSLPLVQSILQVKQAWTHDSYTMNRLSSYKGKWIRGCDWYPDKKLRLWDSSKGIWGGDSVHEKLILQADTTRLHLSGDLLHYAFDNATELINKMQQYSSIYAAENFLKKRVTVLQIVSKTLFAFFRNYILKMGFMEGYEGVVISVSNANGVFYKYAKLYEVNKHFTASLIISTYNRKDALELVLLSILGQTILPDEVIIADDGSSEDTARLIKEYKNRFPVPLIHCWQEDEGFKLATIRNKAIALAKSKYIIMADGDMVLQKNFIKSHKKAALRHHFIQGSRVLLSEVLTKNAIAGKVTLFNLFQKGLTNRLNAINSPLLSRIFSKKRADIRGIRGCNMAFWKEDVIAVNGFNEAFQGWGREDSEFVVRLFNKGIKRKNLKFGGVAYHLYHQEHARTSLPQNDSILEKAIAEKKISCIKGIRQYLPGHIPDHMIDSDSEQPKKFL